MGFGISVQQLMRGEAANKPALPGLSNPDHLQVRSPAQTKHSDWFFLLVLNDQPQGIGVVRSDFQSMLHRLLQCRE